MRSKQISAALSVLLDGHPGNEDPAWREYCEWAIEQQLRVTDEAESFDTESGYEFEHAHIRSAATKRELKKAIKHMKLAHLALTKLPPRVRRSFVDLKVQIRRAELWTTVRPGTSTHTGFKQFVAVLGAAGLFETTLQKVSTTRWNRWHKLAAILYGDKSAIAGRKPGIDFFNHMREYERQYRPHMPHLFPPRKVRT